jgi:myosin heavy subunit
MEFSPVAEKGISDMVEIDELNHATLLQNLASRYRKDEIFTYVGPILLVMNPFKAMPQLLSEDVVKSIIR